MSRKYYRGSSMTIDWDGDDLMERMYKLADAVTERAGNEALNTAQSLVPKDTGKLAAQIEIKKSKFEGGGVVIVAQGKDNVDYYVTKDGKKKADYYAAYVELGTHTTVNQPAQPYLRPAIKRVRRIFKKLVQDEIDK